MLSNASKYSIKAVLFLAEKSDDSSKLSVQIIADTLMIPKPFIAKLLQRLAKAQIISSTKGPNGGFYLSENDKYHSICDIIEVIDGPHFFEGCFMGLSKCNDENPCSVHPIVAKFREQILHQFKEKTIEDFSAEVQNNKGLLDI
ncbi:MAG: Rrf2 family transcriptional regulator [Flavobacteriaceae bacterium]|nr:Rrf2 family transcriptional regulator [Flavobacteriaceae bacterium]